MIRKRWSGRPVGIQSGLLHTADRRPDFLDAGREQVIVSLRRKRDLDFGRQNMQLVRELRMRGYQSALQLDA